MKKLRISVCRVSEISSHNSLAKKVWPSIHFIIANWLPRAMFRLSGPSRPGGEGFLLLNEFLISPYDFGAISRHHRRALTKNLEMDQNNIVHVSVWF